MRISSSEFYNYNIQSMDSEQSQLDQLFQQLSSGQALTTPADNPLAAAQAVQLSMSSSALAQYTTNQNAASSSLGLEDQTLGSVTNVLQQISTLTVQAGDSSLSDSDRTAIASEMQGYRNQLFTLANSTDGGGNYVFSGFQATAQPFSNAAGGGVNYLGDAGIRQAQVTDTQQIATNDSGSSVFLSVPSIGTVPVSAGAAANTGTGTITSPAITAVGAATNTDSYTITFGGTAAAPTYTVTDSTLGTTTAPAAYTAGAPIALGAGMTVAVSGTPNPADTFSVSPATSPANSSMFSSIDSMIAALQQPISNNPAAQATLTNEMTTGMTQLQNSLTNVTVVQASVGGREQQLKALQTSMQASTLQTQNDLSNLTTVDTVSAISKLEQTQSTLQAAEQSFAKIQGMSLFQYLGN